MTGRRCSKNPLMALGFCVNKVVAAQAENPSYMARKLR